MSFVVSTVLSWGQDAPTTGPAPLLLSNGAEIPALAAEQVPFAGTFWSLQYPDMPPMPYNFAPVDGLAVYQLPDGSMVIDDLQVDYVAIREELALGAMLSGATMNSMEDGGVTDPPPPYVYPSNTLYLEITALSNNVEHVRLHGTVADTVYEIQSQENLGGPGWFTEQTLLGASGQEFTPTTISMTGRTNLFLRIRAWVDSKGSGLPDWWQLQYFGQTAVDPYADPDGDGWTNIEEMQNGTNPLAWNTPPAPRAVTARISISSPTTAMLDWAPGNPNILQI